jgi:SET domain-containing protein
MKTDDVIVKGSSIEGKGVFAKRDFRKEEVVMKWDMSTTLTKEEAAKLPEDEEKFLTESDGVFTWHQAPEKYVNHSCDPNTYEKDNCDIALRDIKKGEEITTDYGKAEGSEPHFRCTCGSKVCKKRIKSYEF